MTLVYTFVYEGVSYTITIPAGMAVDNDIPWYGPLYLLEMYGSYSIESDIASDLTVTTTSATYTVVKGDTLSEIAVENGLTLAEIVEKNPQISNIDLIYPGDQINL
ncbi:MAG: LysM peptidoglycan-binding domain-containing protein [Lachnospiraceae bacterium]|nr:LysM peptidoglycan-binding domain-containing protein [Lachnospiraceae bacterium]